MFILYKSNKTSLYPRKVVFVAFMVCFIFYRAGSLRSWFILRSQRQWYLRWSSTSVLRNWSFRGMVKFFWNMIWLRLFFYGYCAKDQFSLYDHKASKFALPSKQSIINQRRTKIKKLRNLKNISSYFVKLNWKTLILFASKPPWQYFK